MADPSGKGNKDPKYHITKTCVANKHGYKCIHIWDWDDVNKIKAQLSDNKSILYAKNLNIRLVNKKDLDLFLNTYHLQNTCNGQIIKLGLYKEDELIEVMTFGKPRYNKKYEWELLRLCTNSKYKVTGGAQRLFKYFIKEYKPESIISYCDKSKFEGDIYFNLGMRIETYNDPSKHWYNYKTGKHITDNLLRQRGFSQLHGDKAYIKYNKGDSNELLMIDNGYLPIYDCGQATYVWHK